MEKINNIEISTYGNTKKTKTINKKPDVLEKNTKTTTKSLKIGDGKKNKNAGLRLGAHSIIFAYLGLISYLNPTHFDFIPYGFSIDGMILIPETFFLILIFTILAIGFSVSGTIFSLMKKSVLGFLLSFLILGNTIYLSIVANNMYKTNPSIVHQMTSVPSVWDLTSRIKFVEKGDTKKLFE